MQTEKLSKLAINLMLSREQFEAAKADGKIVETGLYLYPDQGYIDWYETGVTEATLQYTLQHVCIPRVTERRHLYRFILEIRGTYQHFTDDVYLFEVVRGDAQLTYITATNGKDTVSFTYSDEHEIFSEYTHTNPPMHPGVEYCTAEFYNGKSVYVKQIALNRSFSDFNGKKWANTATSISTEDTEIVSFTALAFHPTMGPITFPWFPDGYGPMLYLHVYAGEQRYTVNVYFESEKMPTLNINEFQKLECTFKYIKK